MQTANEQNDKMEIKLRRMQRQIEGNAKILQTSSIFNKKSSKIANYVKLNCVAMSNNLWKFVKLFNWTKSNVNGEIMADDFQ